MVFVGGSSQCIQDAILDSEDMKKLFVTKIPVDANDEDVKAFLESKAGGQITEHVVIHKENAKNHFGFFTFAHSSLVDEVIFKEKELIYNSSTLEVNRAVPKEHYLTGAHHKAKKLFIANLPKTGITEEEMKKYFDERHDPRYGIVEKVEFIKKKDEAGNRLEENKGFGFITVSSEHFADTLSIQYAKFDFGGQRVELKKSDKDNQNQQGARGGGGRGRGARGGSRGGGTGAHYGGGNSGYGGYDGYGNYSYDAYGSGYNSWDYYSGYDMTYPQYGVSSSTTRGGGGGISDRGGNRGGRGAGSGKYERGGARGGARGGKSDRGNNRGGAGARGSGGNRGAKRYAPY